MAVLRAVIPVVRILASSDQGPKIGTSVILPSITRALLRGGTSLYTFPTRWMTISCLTLVHVYHNTHKILDKNFILVALS